MDQMPEIYCAIVLNFDKIIAEAPPFTDDIKTMDIKGVKFWLPKHRKGSKLTIAEIYYEKFWDLEDALTHLFQIVDGKLPTIKEINKKYNGKVLLDIAFYQYGTYPSLTLDGQNMEKIRFLEADISIDPYGPFNDQSGDG
ncbi:MAG: hypothetical protein IKJ63_11485 [Clostridia bacterium]|nr:hypothetical protein [Clostridia bacterium]